MRIRHCATVGRHRVEDAPLRVRDVDRAHHMFISKKQHVASMVHAQAPCTTDDSKRVEAAKAGRTNP